MTQRYLKLERLASLGPVAGGKSPGPTQGNPPSPTATKGLHRQMVSKSSPACSMLFQVQLSMKSYAITLLTLCERKLVDQ